MTIQDDILRAKQQYDIPVYVVPDKPGGVKPSYGDELLGQAGPGNYQYNFGKSTYAPFAPGTQTLAAKQFDEEKRANAVAEAFRLKELQTKQAKDSNKSSAPSSGIENSNKKNSLVLDANPFINPEPYSSKLYGYDINRIDTYIANLRKRLITPDAVLSHINKSSSLAPNFKKAVLEQLKNMTTNG